MMLNCGIPGKPGARQHKVLQQSKERGEDKIFVRNRLGGPGACSPGTFLYFSGSSELAGNESKTVMRSDFCQFILAKNDPNF